MKIFFVASVFLFSISFIAEPSKRFTAEVFAVVMALAGCGAYWRNQSKAKKFLDSLKWARVMDSNAETTIAIGHLVGKKSYHQLAFEGAVRLDATAAEFRNAFEHNPDVFVTEQGRFLPFRFLINSQEDTVTAKLDDPVLIQRLESLKPPVLSGLVSSESITVADNEISKADFEKEWQLYR